MSIHLFFDIITAFVNAQFIANLEFFNAGKIKYFDYAFNHFSGA